MLYGKTEWNRRPAECRAFIERAAGPAEALPKKMVNCMTAGAPRVHTAREHARRRQPAERGLRSVAVRRKIDCQICCVDAMRGLSVLFMHMLAWRKKNLDLSETGPRPDIREAIRSYSKLVKTQYIFNPFPILGARRASGGRVLQCIAAWRRPAPRPNPKRRNPVRIMPKSRGGLGMENIHSRSKWPDSNMNLSANWRLRISSGTKLEK